MKNYLLEAESIAKEAGQVLREHFFSAKHVEHKGRTDLVTEIDKKSEEIIYGRLKGSFPGHSIICEEGSIRDSKSEYRWIVDPLDGTTNFVHSFPFVAVSIGLEYKGQIVGGVVYNPILNEMFSAEKGSGSFMNGQKLHVSKALKVINSLVVTGFPYKKDATYDFALELFCKFSASSQGIRRVGAAALDLCYVARGSFEGFFEYNLFPWDTAAGCIIVTEAGGRVTDMHGGSFTPFAKEILATNGFVHDEMLDIIKNEEVKAAR